MPLSEAAWTRRVVDAELGSVEFDPHGVHREPGGRTTLGSRGDALVGIGQFFRACVQIAQHLFERGAPLLDDQRLLPKPALEQDGVGDIGDLMDRVSDLAASRDARRLATPSASGS